jgi:hypothetical protein
MEKRAITNGEPWGFARLLMVGDNLMSAFIRMLRAKTWGQKFSIIKRALKVYAPLALVHWGGVVRVSRLPWGKWRCSSVGCAD